MTETFLDGKVALHAGDCVEVMRSLPEASVDAIVCDPPYGLEFMGKAWDSFTGAGMTKPGIGERDTEWPSFTGTNRTRCRNCGHLVGQGGSACKCASPKPYNAALPRSVGFGDWCFTWAAEALRVLKPGGHLVAFSGTRTYHRMACAIEDAGFEIRDQIAFASDSEGASDRFLASLNDEQRAAFAALMDELLPTGMAAWSYGSGFPKSLNVAKAIDAGGGRPEDIRRMDMGDDYEPSGRGRVNYDHGGGSAMNGASGGYQPKTKAARQWQGWGTALKPAWEPICLARKPLIGTVVQNVLKHGTGALNVDGCRVAAEGRPLRELDAKATDSNVYAGRTGDGGLGKGLDGGSKAVGTTDLGRFPANLAHDGSEEVLACFPSEAGAAAPVRGTESSKASNGGITGERQRVPGAFHSDSGSAARFFYTAKADASDRIGSKHPTVKPVDLLRWLTKLVTPPGGTVLDPFAGTGTTGEAAFLEGFRAILIEREQEYQQDIKRRMELILQPTKRTAVAKSKNKLDDPLDLPLFAELKHGE